MPVLPARGFDKPGIGPGLQQAHALEGHPCHQSRHVLGQHQIAAAAQHEQRRSLPGQRGQGGQLRGSIKRDECVSPGGQPQRVQAGEILDNRRQRFGREVNERI
ncbi:hypothetical protein D3C87_1759530 [compost metagenome]